MKKRMCYLLSVLLVLTFLAGCSAGNGAEETGQTTAQTSAEEQTEVSTPAGEEQADPEFVKKELSELKVGIAFYAYASASAIRQLDYLRYVFENAGCEVAYAIANNSVEQQISDVESLIEQQCDVIILDPCQMEGYEDVLQSCKEAEIPVFIMGNTLNPDVYTAGEDYVTLLQSDMILQGESAGEAALRAAKEELNGKVNAVVIFGTPGMQSATDRVNGWNNVDSREDMIVTIGTQTAYNKAAEAQAIVENYIMSSGGPESEGGVNCIICMTHNCAIGAIAAVKNMGYTPNEDIYIIVVDGVKEDLQSIMDGDIYIAVESPCFYAEQQLELIEKYFQGETLEPYYEITSTVFDSTNAQEWYDKFNEYDSLIGYEG